MAGHEGQPYSFYPFIIVGGGIAGVSCVEQILAYDKEAKILLVSASPVVKEASGVTKIGKSALLEEFLVVSRSFRDFSALRPSVTLIHDEVTSLDVPAHAIQTRNGRTFSYGKICLCLGASPKVLFPSEPDVVLGIRDTESVEVLRSRLGSARKVLLLGNGGIATEFVYEVQDINVIWAIKDDSISTAFVDKGAAEFFLKAKLLGGNGNNSKVENPAPTHSYIKRMKYTTSSSAALKSHSSQSSKTSGSALGPDWAQNLSLHGGEHGKQVQILYNVECISIERNKEFTQTGNQSNSDVKDERTSWPVIAHMSDGTTLGVDLILSATGVKPNLPEWLESLLHSPDMPQSQDSSFEGVPVNERMETRLVDVYCAGDMCWPTWEWAPQWFPMRLWTQARHMGLYAGKSMYMKSIGEDASLDFCFEYFTHVTRFFGFRVVLLGLFNGQGIKEEEKSQCELLLRVTPGQEYVKVLLKEGRMIGALLIGETGLEETFENLILSGIDLSPFGEDLLNPDVDIEDYFD